MKNDAPWSTPEPAPSTPDGTPRTPEAARAVPRTAGGKPARPFLRAQWRSLVMLNYEIDPAILQPFVPPGTELDNWNGKTFVSVVGFLFLKTRVMGAAIPFHANFPEVNLRFYVRRKSAQSWQRGVTFLREIVPRPAISFVANTLYNERYLTLPMRHDVALESSSGHAEYSWRYAKNWNRLQVESKGDWQPLQSASLEEFITEHFWGYAAQRGGGAMEYRVQHPRWRIKSVAHAAFDCDVKAIYGLEYSRPLGGTPHSAFVAEGSAVQVYRGVRIC